MNGFLTTYVNLQCLCSMLLASKFNFQIIDTKILGATQEYWAYIRKYP